MVSTTFSVQSVFNFIHKEFALNISRIQHILVLSLLHNPDLWIWLYVSIVLVDYIKLYDDVHLRPCG